MKSTRKIFCSSYKYQKTILLEICWISVTKRIRQLHMFSRSFIHSRERSFACFVDLSQVCNICLLSSMTIIPLTAFRKWTTVSKYKINYCYQLNMNNLFTGHLINLCDPEPVYTGRTRSTPRVADDLAHCVATASAAAMVWTMKNKRELVLGDEGFHLPVPSRW